MIITFRVTDKQAAIIKEYAKQKNMTVSGFIREAVTARIANETNKSFEKTIDTSAKV